MRYDTKVRIFLVTSPSLFFILVNWSWIIRKENLNENDKHWIVFDQEKRYDECAQYTVKQQIIRWNVGEAALLFCFLILENLDNKLNKWKFPTFFGKTAQDIQDYPLHFQLHHYLIDIIKKSIKLFIDCYIESTV